jgi:hypothetical protein
MARLVSIPKHFRTPELDRRQPRNVNFRDLTGRKTANGCEVLGYAGILDCNGAGWSAWLCRCSCGCMFIATSNQLRRPVTCGCSTTPLYRVWQHMLARCYNKRYHSYPQYGGAGITVCKRWRDSFKRFAEDVGPRPAGRCYFERIRPSGNYTRGNWQWTRPKGTGNPKTLYITYQGETLGVRQWAERSGISRQAMQYRVDRCLKLGLDASQALLVPKPRSGGRGAAIRSFLPLQASPRRLNMS